MGCWGQPQMIAWLAVWLMRVACTPAASRQPLPVSQPATYHLNATDQLPAVEFHNHGFEWQSRCVRVRVSVLSLLLGRWVCVEQLAAGSKDCAAVLVLCHFFNCCNLQLKKMTQLHNTRTQFVVVALGPRWVEGGGQPVLAWYCCGIFSVFFPLHFF